MNNIYGMLAEYEDQGTIFEGLTKIRSLGYKKIDIFSPFPIHGMEEMFMGKSLKRQSRKLSNTVFGFGMVGFLAIFGLITWVSVFNYPLNIGGRPLMSFPAFIPPMFEITILFSGITTVITMLYLNGLPKWHNPLFNSVKFKRVTDDRFFLLIYATDCRFNSTQTQIDLMKSNALSVEVILKD
ncbi:MAG: DUF3341 domain-containing protein [Deltaproteobacteria bacterium]|nr:MAG: DUF3341 domain-containing protein [Deltaproteobacteria bacterium]